MANREEWTETAFTVFTDEDGVLRSGYYPTGEGTVTGNVQVDRVWGNLPMQPNEDRTDIGTSIGGGYGDVGWSSTYVATSDTLRTADYQLELNNLDYRVPADSHTIATTGYSNYPQFLENYAGDGDADLETVVPNVRGLLRDVAQNKIVSANLDWNRTYVNPDVLTVESTAKVVTITTDGDHYLRVGDVVSVYYNDNDEFSGHWVDVTITLVPASDAFKFELDVAPNPALDFSAVNSYVWTNNRFVIAQDQEPGTIINAGDEVGILVLQND